MATTDPRRWAALRGAFEEIVELSKAQQVARLSELHASDPSFATALERLLLADDRGQGPDPITSCLDAALRVLTEEVGTTIDDAVPDWIGEYRIMGRLGSGGMGVVFLAEQQSPKRVVALKVIRGIGGASAVRRFQREAELLGRLQHANIALIYEAGLARERDRSGAPTGPNRPYFAMEFVKGEALVAFVQRRALETAERVRLIIKVCDAIAHAHARGVIHRDLKAANILIDDHGEPKVLDFGVARALDRDHAATIETAVGEVIGTLPYMSPEQVAGTPEQIGVATDVYALGVVLFEALTGRRPIDLTGRTLPEAVRLISDEEPTRLASIDRSLRGDLETIVARCLEKDPKRRYPSASALADDLRRHLAHEPIEARPASTLYQLTKFTRRHRPLVVGITTAFAALIVATVVSINMAIRADRDRQAAEHAGNELARQLEVSEALTKDLERAKHDLEAQLRYAQVENDRSTQSFTFLRDLLTAADPARSGGRDMTVRELVLRAADTLERSEADKQVTGQLGQLIGRTLFRLGDLPNAERAMRRAVTLLRAPDPAAVSPEYFLIEALTQFGDVLRESGKLEDSAAALTEAIELRTAMLQKWAEQDGAAPRKADVALAVALNNLSLLHRERGDLVAAEEVGIRALEMEQALDAAGANRKSSLAVALVNLAGTRMMRGRAGEAEAPLRQALEIGEAHLGPDAPLTHTFRNNLASALAALGRHDEAIALMRIIVEARDRLLPAGHFERSRAIANLASHLAATGRLLEALPLARRAVDESRVGHAESQELGITVLSSAHVLMGLGDLKGAEAAVTEADALLAPILPADNARRIDVAVVRARLARLNGRIDEARALASAAASLGVASANPRTPPVFLVRREAALDLAARGESADLDRAATELDTLLTEQSGHLGDTHPQTAQTRLVLAEVLRARSLGAHDDRASLDRARAAALAREAATVLDKPERSAPWLAAYARLLAELASAPDAARASSWNDRVDAVRAQLIAVAGDQAPDLARVEALRNR